MGSKSSMLRGELGSQIASLAPLAGRFVDLFSGSGSVAKHVALSTDLPVHPVDLMKFSAVLTGATINRVQAVDPKKLYASWSTRALRYSEELSSVEAHAREFDDPQDGAMVKAARVYCSSSLPSAFIWTHYGGHYFSPTQALHLSALQATLPKRDPHRIIALASLLRTASRASASPGHTAQPFQPTERLLPHLRAAWRVDIFADVHHQLAALAPFPARTKGLATVGDSIEFARTQVRQGDLVFCDPPYSEAQYSRFYHVLEGIARGGWAQISGAGRAPQTELRPSSQFSLKTGAANATASLIGHLARTSCTVLWTYPEGERSNGLTVDHIRREALRHFRVSETLIPMRHSTLGESKENHENRHGRRELQEVLLLMSPRA